MKARKALPLLLVLFFAFALVVPAAMAQDGVDPNTVPPVLPDLEGRVITAVSSNDYVPFSFVDQASGKTIGFEYELLDEICRRLNCELDHQTAAWDGLLAKINEGEYDLGHIGITILDERKELVDFSDPFVTVEVKMMVRGDEDRFTDQASFLDNPELRFGAQPGTTSYFTAEFIVGEDKAAERIVPYDSFAIAVEALVRGDVDAVITDTVGGAGYIGVYAGQLKLLDETVYTDPLGFVFPKDSDLVEPFNYAMESMRFDGYLDYLSNKWFFIFEP
ncbi:MAG: transporter substrate-binding domain-containing protein [Anaerolineae bacterium]|nr:transporter substrate-binding domain-containing protein [Anaerolineae bacterium]